MIFRAIRDNSVRGVTDINALAAKNDKSETVMVWNYHYDNILSDFEATVEVKLTGLPDGEFIVSL